MFEIDTSNWYIWKQDVSTHRHFSP